MLNKDIIASRKGQKKALRRKVIKRQSYLLRQIYILRRKLNQGGEYKMSEEDTKRLYKLEDKSAMSALTAQEKAELARLRALKERQPAIPA